MAIQELHPGLAEELKQVLADYRNSKGEGEITLDQGEAVGVMLERHERVCGILPRGEGQKRSNPPEILKKLFTGYFAAPGDSAFKFPGCDFELFKGNGLLARYGPAIRQCTMTLLTLTKQTFDAHGVCVHGVAQTEVCLQFVPTTQALPPVICRNCQKALPPMVVWTRTFAPMAEQLRA